MLKRLVVGVNGSKFSRAAQELALRCAADHQAELVGVAVVDLPHLVHSEPVSIGGTAYKAERDQTVAQAAESEAAELLATFEQHCLAAGVRGRSLKLEGDPAQLLVREAQRGDLLVVGHKGEPLGDGAVTRTLERVLRSASCPVLCVPAAPAAGGSVLIAYDGSPQSAKALHAFRSLGLAKGRELHILTVAHDVAHQDAADVAEDYLRAHGEQAQRHVETAKVPVAAAILAEAQRLGVGLLVMGSYGKPRLREMVFGSVTASVLEESPVPIFLYY
jgi:nucleotide-binding universal stress UspA family protein